MAGPYSYLTDDELVAEIADYRSAVKSLSIGGGLKEIGGEGRRKVVNAGSLADVRTELRNLLAEFNNRPSLCPGGPDGGSLLIEFGHGGEGGGFFGGY